MRSTSTALQRALTHRHTPAGRRFWTDVTAALAGNAEALRAMLLLAADGPASIPVWLEQAGAPLNAATSIERALDELSVEHTTRPARMARIRDLIRGTAHLSIIRTESTATV